MLKKYHNTYKVGELITILQQAIEQNVTHALNEDVVRNDVSSNLIDADRLGQAQITCQQDAVLAGCFWVDAVFNQLNPKTCIEWNYRDGSTIKAQQIICTIDSSLRTILTGERIALNFLQTLSATATITKQFVDQIGSNTMLLDTRKTLPNLRVAQKYAVACGGGNNHRHHLSEMIMIKDNHISAYGSISQAITHAQKLFPDMTIEVEVETLDQIEEVCANHADIIMLDNFTLSDIPTAIQLVNKRSLIEISGNICLQNISEYAQPGVDFISVGDITKNISAIDMSLEMCYSH